MGELDLNLLRIFAALADERNVTRAARRIGLSQPAFSHALQRLRDVLGDPLFVRVPRGMVPTPRAAELEPLVRDLLARAERLTQPVAFDPATCRRTFRIATTDYFEHIAFPRLVAAFTRAAPHATIISQPSGSDLPKAQLAEGAFDLAIAGFFGSPPDGFFQQDLFEESFVCLVRADHPGVGRRLTLAQYTRLSHMLISPGGDLHGVADRVLAAMKRKRHVAVGVSSFLSPAWILPHTDLVLTAPRRLAKMVQQPLALRILAPPVDLPGFTVAQVWHERHHHDPAHAWLRASIREACNPSPGR